MSKKHKIKTVQDILECTNEDNIDYFLKDLKAVLIAAYPIKQISIALGEDYSAMIEDGFTWIDDKKHDINITIEPIGSE